MYTMKTANDCRVKLCALTGLGLLVWFSTAQGTRGEVAVAPTDPLILYTGRFDHTNASQPKFGWSGTSILANFEGTSLKARFSDSGDDHLYVVIDDATPVSLDLQQQSKEYTLAAGLADGMHKVEIVKKSEGFDGTVTFEEFILDDGKSLFAPPTRPALRLEFFGDSNAAGYSAECICDEGDTKYKDSYFTYPGITSRMLGAEHSNIGVSGITISSGSAGRIRDVWNKTLYNDGSGDWDFNQYVPDAVIINLGANDLYAGRTKNQIKNGWMSFISDQLRTVYPDAHVVLANSIGWDHNEPANYIDEAVQELHAAGDMNVSYVKFPWLWSQAHAVTFEHAGFANILAAHLANELELPQPEPNTLSSFAPPGQVANGSFEKSDLPGDPDGWRSFGSGSTLLEDVTDAHSGADIIQASGNSGFWHATSAQPGDQFEVTAWARGAAGQQGQVRLEFKDQSQSVLSALTTTFPATSEWQQYSTVSTAPAGTWQVNVMLRTSGSNTVQFDDVLLRNLTNPPVSSADFDSNGLVDGKDFLVWQRGLGTVGVELHAIGDANGDGTVDGVDLSVWIQQNGNYSLIGTTVAVPEPHSWLMLSMLAFHSIALGR
jgi:lysophospholipase L1-like esterase